MWMLNARTIFVSQIQVSSCLDEELDTWQISRGTDKVQPAAYHSVRQCCEAIPVQQTVFYRGRRAWYLVLNQSTRCQIPSEAAGDRR